MSAAAKSLVETLAIMGLQGTVLAVLALAVVRAGALRPGWQAAVWLVVLTKFVLPWGPALPWSLSDLLAALRHSPEGGAIAIAPAVGAVATPSVSVGWLVLAAAWLVGAAIVLGRALLAQHRVTHAARRAPLAPPHAQKLLASFARRPPRLVVGDAAVGPHVVGIVRPIIVVPPALLDDSTVLCAALLHELAHVRRRDALARIVQLVAGAAFFCWPVVRLVSRRLDLAREAACDAWALDASEVSRPAYARLLVRMAQLRASAATSLAASCGLDARVAAVLGPPARVRLGVVHRLALIIWIALALGGARTASANSDRGSCKYTPQLAEALRQAHPEADLDGDGVLTRDEACELQAELRRRVETPASELVTPLERRGREDQDDQRERPALELIDESLLTDPLCCNCDRGAEHSAPWGDQRLDACQSEEGVSR
jgi:beta-lactamase regulating signal transducer with metallopeptidase domain